MRHQLSEALKFIARVYGIRIIPVRYQSIPKEKAIPNSSLGVGCDPGRREVYWDWKRQQETGLQHQEELLLHEMCHIIVQPPRYALKNVPELALLLPFEYALLTQYLPEHAGQGMSFQYGTYIKLRYRGQYYWEFGHLALNFYHKPEKAYQHPLFCRGLLLCKRLGLINETGRVNLGAYPRWCGNFLAFRRQLRATRPSKPYKFKKVKYALDAASAGV